MLLPEPQRRLLGAFLRTHREALPGPQTALSRRRTPGLRREEVAQLSGLSTTWYTWAEQGRDIALSPTALARLADALRLSPAERAYLFELTRRRDPAPPVPPGAPDIAAPAELSALLPTIETPTYLLDRLWHARGWNAAAGHLFAPWLDSGETCLLRYVFLDPGARGFIYDWEDRARRLLAEFRADTAAEPEDPEIARLIAELRQGSPSFALFWNQHAVLAREGGERLFNHPRDGLLRYTQMTLTPAAHPSWKLVTLLPQA